MFALYIPRQSFVHRASPRLKLLALFALGVAITFVTSPFMLGVLLAVCVIAFALARLPLRAFLAAFAPILVTVALFTGLQLAFAGVEAAAVTALRTLSLVLAAALVTLTTPFAAMIEVLTEAARPLMRFGLSAAKTGLAIALAVRFIPVLMKDFQEMQAARTARGGSRWSVLALGPLLVKTLQAAGDLSDAITARGFENRDSLPGRGRS